MRAEIAKSLDQGVGREDYIRIEDEMIHVVTPCEGEIVPSSVPDVPMTAQDLKEEPIDWGPERRFDEPVYRLRVSRPVVHQPEVRAGQQVRRPGTIERNAE
jgi:hypothetical protein